MNKFIFTLLTICVPFVVFAQKGKAVFNGTRALTSRGVIQRAKYVTPTIKPLDPVKQANIQAALQAAQAQAMRTSVSRPQVEAKTSRVGYLYVGIPFMNMDFFHTSQSPKRNLINKRYPSGLLDEEQLTQDWLEYFRNGDFRPRDQVEAIEGMSPRQMNNIIEYLYWMPMEEAQEIILNPLRETGRLPDFMYDNKLIPGTKRLPAQYYKNKFNENVKIFVNLAEEDGTIFTHNAQLKELMSAMKDYTFKQGFTYINSSELANGLRKNWEALYGEISKPGVNSANRALINELWSRPVVLPDGKEVSLRSYFTQRRKTAFFDEAVPEFYLNSPKWVALENERRNLIAAESYPFSAQDVSAFNYLQMRLILGKPEQYLTLEQFGHMMTEPYKQAYGSLREAFKQQAAVSMQNDPLLGLKAQIPTSTTIQVNNFDKLGGVCQMAFTDGGYMGRLQEGYDGTSTVARFEPVVFDKVRVVTFDAQTLEPQVVTLDKVSYVKDLKKPNIDRVRASSMVGDGLDVSRDVLSVDQAEKALQDIPHLRATIYPQNRVKNADEVPYMKGGGLAAYLALFTPDFYPIKTVRLLKKVDGNWQWVPTYFVRKEVLTHAGFVHRDRLTFTDQVKDRIVEAE